jgi:PAS domain S-box-containing protein
MAGTPKPTILNVDDNDAGLYAKNRILRRAGFEVYEATTGGEALRIVFEKKPQLVLLDVRLPDISGIEVCRRIKADPATSSILVIQNSATFLDSSDRVRALEGGADTYLTEPIEADELVANVRAMLRLQQAEQAVRESEAWLATTLRSIGDAVIATDLEGCVILINRVAQNLVGWEEAEARGRLLTEVFQIIDEQTRQPAENPVAGVLRDGSTASLTNHHLLVARSGREMLIDNTAAQIKDEQGNLIGVVLIFRDITERKRAEEALRSSEERYRLMVENAKDYAIIMLDPEGLIATWNAGAERILGYSEAEVIGRPGKIIFTAADISAGKSEEELRKALTEGRAVNERWHRRKDGSRFWGSGMIMPLYDETGELRGFVNVFRDLTEHKRTEDERDNALEREQQLRQKAEDANRLKDEFLATVSHELRTPLNHVLGWVAMLRSGRLQPDQARNALETIERNVRAQNRLIEDLLDVSRIITGKLKLDLQTVEITKVIIAVAELASPVAEAKGVQLLIEGESAERAAISGQHSGIEVMGDPDRLHQALWNLVSNAIKFTPVGGRVEIKLRRRPNQIEIEVADTGEGIGPDFLPYVFDRFRQADASTKRKHSGLGLGLSIVRHLVELHGGSVRADSPGEDQGSTFVITLPVERAQPENKGQKSPPAIAAERPRSEDAPRLDGLRVLVVDDDPDARSLLLSMLSDYGVQVRTAEGTREALAILDEWSPDVLVADIGMPEGDGYDLIREVRHREGNARRPMPAIALTAYARREDRLRALSSGFQMHVPKPVEPAELLTVLASLSGRIG